MDSTGLVLAAFSCIALFMLIPPLVYHAKNKNIPACSLIFWLCFRNLVSFINALIWSSNDFYNATDGKGYCDLVVRIDSGSSAGELSAITCLIFNLYMIMSTKSHTFFDNSSKRKITINIMMCWTLPIIVMGTSFAVQATRYVIFRYLGCSAVYDNTYWYIFLVAIWSPICSVIALVFAILTTAVFFKKRRDIKDIVRCTNSGLNNRRFARLLIFSLLIVFVMTPLVFYNFITNVDNLRKNDANWKIQKSPYWSTIVAYETSTVELATTIINICLSGCTFLLFGLGSDALSLYLDIFVALGFKAFKRKIDQEFTVSSNFTSSKQNTRTTVETEETAAVSEKDLKSKGIVEVHSMDSNVLGFTLSNVSPDDLDMSSLGDYDVERIIRGNFEPDPEFQFEFKEGHINV